MEEGGGREEHRLVLPARITIEDPVSAQRQRQRLQRSAVTKSVTSPKPAGQRIPPSDMPMYHECKACSNKLLTPCKTRVASFSPLVGMQLIICISLRGHVDTFKRTSHKNIPTKWAALARHLPSTARFSRALQRTVTNMCLCSYEDTHGERMGAVAWCSG